MLIDINYFSNFLGYAVGLRSHHMLVLTDPGMGWMCTQRNSFLSEELTMLCWWACLLKMWPLRQQQEAHLRHRHKGRVQTLQSYWTRICILNGTPLFGMCNIGEVCWSIGPYLLGIWIHSAYSKSWASFVVHMIKNLPTMQETWVQSLVGKIPWRRKWQPTPGLLPGKFHGQRSGTSYSPWNHKESDTTVWLAFIFTLHMKPWSTTLKCLIKCKWCINMNYYYYPGWREVILLLCHKAAFGLAERTLDFESEDVNLIISFVMSHLFYLSCAIKFPWLSCSQSV